MGPNGPHAELIYHDSIVFKAGLVVGSFLCIREFG